VGCFPNESLKSPFLLVLEETGGSLASFMSEGGGGKKKPVRGLLHISGVCWSGLHRALTKSVSFGSWWSGSSGRMSV
jgi:hypothetical protein